MVFFELEDVDKMLDNTHDPSGNFINAATSDVVAFCAECTNEEFLAKTTLLNDLLSLSSEQLCRQASGIGYAVNKVMFWGFHASNALQAMHDNSIQERTRLKLDRDGAAAAVTPRHAARQGGGDGGQGGRSAAQAVAGGRGARVGGRSSGAWCGTTCRHRWPKRRWPARQRGSAR